MKIYTLDTNSWILTDVANRLKNILSFRILCRIAVYGACCQIICTSFSKIFQLSGSIALIILLLFSKSLFSLPVFILIPANKYWINGNIIDAESGSAIPFSKIQIQINDHIIKQLASNEDGYFKFSLDSIGKYTILINSVGFQPWEHELNVDNHIANVELGIIRLSPNREVLDEVAIIAQKSLFRIEADKIIYDIEADPDSKSANALEMLQKMPMVTVDGDENIQVRGSSNFKILLNGKATSMFAQNPQEVLRSFPAASIKNIELITNPSSKYEAEGIGGIINIITTKKQPDGFLGSVDTRVSTLGDYSGGGYVKSKIKKLGFSINYNYEHFQRPARQTFLTGENFVSSAYRFSESESDVSFKGNFHLFSGEASYEIDSLNLISFSATGYTGEFPLRKDQRSRNFDADHTLSREFTNQFNSVTDRGSISGNIDYQRTFNKPGKTFTVSYKLDRIPQKVEFSNYVSGLLNYDSYRQKSTNDASGTEHTFQLDFYNPVMEKHQFECGAKYILRQNLSNSEILRYDPEHDGWINDKSRENELDYDQQIIGLYTGYVFKLGKFNIKSGLRTEGIINSGNFKSLKDTAFSNRIYNLIPYISFMKTIDKGQNLKLSYTQRLARPGILFLNPYVNDADPLNISFGNPKLDAEISHTFDISYGKFSSKYNFNFSLNSALTNNAIESISTISAMGARTTTYKNIGKNQLYGGAVFGSFQPGNKLNININLGANYVVFEGAAGYRLKNEGLTYSGSMNVKYNLWKNGSITSYVNIISSRILLQGQTSMYWRTNMNLSQEFFDKKLTVSIYALEPLRRNIRYETALIDPEFHQNIVEYSHYRSLSFKLSYRFGEMKGEIKKANRGIINDDIKKNGATSGGAGSAAP